MNRRAMTMRFRAAAAAAGFAPAALIFAVFAAAALGGCDSPRDPAAQLTGTSLEGAPIGGDFELVDKAGKPVRWADFAGRYRIVYFGYTFCPDACPIDVAVMMRGFARFEKEHPALGAKVQPLFITIDPARDTPAAVGEFAAAFSPRLIGLTGTQAQVDVAAKAFRVYAARGKQSAGGYLMDHSRFAYLMDPAGTAIEALPVEQGAEAVAADLALAVR